MPDAIRALFVAPGRFYGEFMQALGDAHHVYEIIAVEDLATAEAVLARDPIRIAVGSCGKCAKDTRECGRRPAAKR